MKHQDNIEAVAALQPDYLGFIFHEDSPRYFDNVIPDLSANIKRVGVFVDKPIEFIVGKIEKYSLNVIQLHGYESPEVCKLLKSANVEVIKVFSINDEFDFSVLEVYENVCDYFLFDTKGRLPGGNGYSFDWKVLKDYPSTKPFFLSGGIGLDEIDSILSFLRSQESKYCYALDVNSKFESKPGLKRIEQLKEFKTSLRVTK